MSAAREVIPATRAVAILTALGLSVATFHRGRKPKKRTQPRLTSARALSAAERQAVLDTLHEERFRNLPPAEVFVKLLSEGKYLGSERTMYRVLASQKEVRERRNQLAHPPPLKPELIATGPNEVSTSSRRRGPLPGWRPLRRALLSHRQPGSCPASSTSPARRR